MTHDELLSYCYSAGNRNSDDPNQVTQARLAIRLAIGEASRETRLPSHEVNIQQTLAQDQPDYPLGS